MNHYIVKSEDGVDRVHFKTATLAGAIKDCFIYARVASPEIGWYVLSTTRQLEVGHSIGKGHS